MSLDYKGKPEFFRKRNLATKVSFLKDLPDSVVIQDPSRTVEDQIFTDLFLLYKKGESLKDGFSKLNPAGFIPVEESSSVIAAIQRINPNAEIYTVITFGLFKEACEYISSRGKSLDDEFVINISKVPDPKEQSIQYTKKYKGVSTSGDDWITEFLLSGSAIAGLMLAGHMVDVFGINTERLTFESNSSGNEPKLWFLQGFPLGVSLLIELGINLAVVNLVFGKSSTLSPELRNKFIELADKPEERKKIFLANGYDYDKFVNNNKFNDYKAIKEYALNYISTYSESLNYDHWIGWLQTLECQELLKGSMVLGPIYSNKWKKIFENQDQQSTNPLEQAEKDQDLFESQMSVSLKSYFSSILSLHNDTYNKLYVAYSYNVDERTLCCLLWFLGPLDTKTLENISSLLKLTMFRVNIDLKNLIVFLKNELTTFMLTLVLDSLSKIIYNILNKIFDKLFSVPTNDIDAAIKLCRGIDIVFEMLQLCYKSIISYLEDIVANLYTHLVKQNSNALVASSTVIDRRTAVIITSLLDSVINKLNSVKNICPKEPGSNNIEFINEQAADAAINFVVTKMPTLFPILNIPEEERRKYFKDTQGFTTNLLKIDVRGTDNNGNIIISDNDLKSDCIQNSPALQSTVLGQRIANILKS